MKKPRQQSPRFEQLELFMARTKRPTWESLPQETKQRISELISQLFLEHLQGNAPRSDRKEVDYARQD